MYGYEWTDEYGIFRLTIDAKIQKEIRPVFHEELDFFGMDQYWDYPKDTKAPLMWAEGIRRYIYKGECVAEALGGAFYTKPTIKLLTEERLNLQPINVERFYNGLIRLHLVNQSSKSYELKTTESIVQCFFFELPTVTDAAYKIEYAEKSPYYGINWQLIYDKADPFPVKRESGYENFGTKWKDQCGPIIQFCKQHSLFFTLMCSFFAIVSSAVIFMNSFNEYTGKMDQIVQYLEPALSEIVVTQDEKYGEKIIDVDCAKSDIITVLCNSDDINYKITSGNSEKTTTLRFSVELPSAVTRDTEFDFSYVIIKKIK